MVESTTSKAVKKTKEAASHPKTFDMVVEAIKTLKDKKGTSVQAIKSFILSHYPTVSAAHLTSGLRRAIKSGLESGAFVRPKDSQANGVSGRLRLGKLPEKPKKPAKKKPAPKKKPTKKAAKPEKKTVDKKKKTKPEKVKKSATKKTDKKPAPKVAKKPATKKASSTKKKTPTKKPKKPSTKQNKK